MARISNRRALSKRQKQARKIQRQIRKQKSNHTIKKNLKPDQKISRSEQIARRKEAKQKRKQLNKKQNETKEIKTIQTTVSKIFNSEVLNQLAKATGFIKRSGGEITAFSFMYIVSFGFLGNGAIALTYLVASLRNNFQVDVTPQALSKRINSSGSVKFLKAVLQKLIAVQLKIGLKNSFSETFSMFSGIYLQDSTQITLNEALSEDFKGPGGGASKSALKFDFIYDIANFLVYGMKISSATINDNTHSKDILKYVKSKVLVIRDLGYFSIPILKAIQKKSAYYISRLSITTQIFLTPEDKEPLNVPEFLKKLRENDNKEFKIKVYVGKTERFESRLVVEKVPEHVINQRTAKFKRERKKTPSPYYIEWCGFSIFITNIPQMMFSGKLILALYKIRWQIELAFKNLKLDVEIDVIKGTKKHRIESLIYGRFITIVVLYIIQNYAAKVAGDKEISGEKVVKLLKTDNQLRQAIIKNDMTMLLIAFESDILLVCKQKRNRETTSEQIKRALIDEEIGKSNIMPFNICLEKKFEEISLQKVV